MPVSKQTTAVAGRLCQPLLNDGFLMLRQVRSIARQLEKHLMLLGDCLSTKCPKARRYLAPQFPPQAGCLSILGCKRQGFPHHRKLLRCAVEPRQSALNFRAVRGARLA